VSMLTLELDDELVGLLRQLNQPLPQAAREIIVLELYRRGLISSGKAAELLGMSRLELIQHASRLGIPYLRFTEEEWEAEVAQSERISA
jgi:predicted HTH domain antitoxin